MYFRMLRMNRHALYIPTIDVGTPSDKFLSHHSAKWDAIVIRFHDFENLHSTRGALVTSSEFTCFGHQWRVYMRPGGGTTSEDGMISLGLEHMSTSAESIIISFGFSVITNENGTRVLDKTSSNICPSG